MSNRRRLRRTALEIRLVRGTAAHALQVGRSYRCPDCSSEVGDGATHGDSLAWVEIRHDDTCPWLEARTA